MAICSTVSPSIPNIMGGRACIRGLRIPVSVIVSHFADWLDI